MAVSTPAVIAEVRRAGGACTLRVFEEPLVGDLTLPGESALPSERCAAPLDLVVDPQWGAYGVAVHDLAGGRLARLGPISWVGPGGARVRLSLVGGVVLDALTRDDRGIWF